MLLSGSIILPQYKIIQSLYRGQSYNRYQHFKTVTVAKQFSWDFCFKMLNEEEYLLKPHFPSLQLEKAPRNFKIYV